MNVKGIIDKECTGCSACSLVCPKNAISIQLNNEEFFAANLDPQKCIDCGLCAQVCPKIEKAQGEKLLNGKVYAARMKEKSEVAKSSSGGVAYAFYLKAVSNNWVSVGAVYDAENCVVKGDTAKTVEELEKFRGSKYLQCDFSETFQKCIEMAKKDAELKFLVVGMPCQIAGLNILLIKRKLRERFILVDMFCHGVPTYSVWNEYCKDSKKKYGDLPENVNFRSKRSGWGTFCIEYDCNNKHIVSPGARDFFVKAFFDDVLLNNSCMDCSYRQEMSGADIRIGDFWGARFRADKEGVSAVLILTEQGNDFWNSLSDDMEVIGEYSVKECVNAQSVRPYTNLKQRDEAFTQLKNGTPIKKVIKNYRKKFSFKKKQKAFIKWCLSYLPNDGRNIRRIALKILGRG